MRLPGALASPSPSPSPKSSSSPSAAGIDELGLPRVGLSAVARSGLPPFVPGLAELRPTLVLPPKLGFFALPAPGLPARVALGRTLRAGEREVRGASSSERRLSAALVGARLVRAEGLGELELTTELPS